jgi:hypothetical protein
MFWMFAEVSIRPRLFWNHYSIWRKNNIEYSIHALMSILPIIFIQNNNILYETINGAK